MAQKSSFYHFVPSNLGKKVTAWMLAIIFLVTCAIIYYKLDEIKSLRIMQHV